MQYAHAFHDVNSRRKEKQIRSDLSLRSVRPGSLEHVSSFLGVEFEAALLVVSSGVDQAAKTFERKQMAM